MVDGGEGMVDFLVDVIGGIRVLVCVVGLFFD